MTSGDGPTNGAEVMGTFYRATGCNWPCLTIVLVASLLRASLLLCVVSLVYGMLACNWPCLTTVPSRAGRITAKSIFIAVPCFFSQFYVATRYTKMQAHWSLDLFLSSQIGTARLYSSGLGEPKNSPRINPTFNQCPIYPVRVRKINPINWK